MSAAASTSGAATALLSEAPRDLDPYLAWAIATDGQDHACTAGPKDRLPGDANGRVILVAELKPDAGSLDGLLRWLASLEPGSGAMPSIYANGGAAGFVTLAVAKSALQSPAFAELQRHVKRCCLATDVLPQRPLVRVPRGEWNEKPAGAPVETTPVVVGVIDTGFAFAHAAFRTVGGRLRIAALWDQDPCPAFASIDGRTPPEFGYGREVAREGLQACIDQFTTHGSVDEAACYEAADLPELRHRFTHGTATAATIAARVGTEERLAPGPGEFPSPAGTLLSADEGAPDLVLVQVPRTGVQDSTGQGLAAHVIDGIHYIVARAGPEARRVVVNLSFAIHTGPHDGTDLLEAAIDAAVQHYRARNIELKVVLPTGNSRLDRGHAVFKNDPSTALPLAVPPGCETSNFVEVWLPKGATNSVTLIAPGGQTSIHWSPGSSAAFMPGGALAMAAVIPASSNVRGGQGRQLVLVAIGPTKVLAPGPGARTAAPAGTWLIKVGGIPGKTGTVHAWIAYSQRSAGAAPRARQARFVDPRWDPARFLRPALLDADPHGLVRRAGTISGIATGSESTVVHGDFHRRGIRTISGGSKGGPTTQDAFYDSQPLSGSRSETSNSAPCEESWAQVGVPAPGTRSGSVVRVRGTSFAVPQFIREKFLASASSQADSATTD